MAFTLAFDIYGTLIDTAGVTQALSRLVGEDARVFSDHWRSKQLEYSFRRGLMSQYRDFSICTRDALNYTCDALGHQLSEKDKQALLESYRVLPAFPEVQQALRDLHESGHRLYAFSNGKPGDLVSLIEHAGLTSLFLDTVSVDEIGSFKPDPRVYLHFLERSQSETSQSFLISSNPFDILGADNIGMRSAWVRRSPAALFDPWGVTPSLTISSLSELNQGLANLN